jgi:anti-anti-sigma regulatory factor
VRTVRLDDGTYVLTLGLELDLAAAEQLTVAVRHLPGRRFIVDLTQVAFVDPIGAARLAHAAEGRTLSVVTDDPRAVRLLESIDRSLPVHAMLTDALTA